MSTKISPTNRTTARSTVTTEIMEPSPPVKPKSVTDSRRQLGSNSTSSLSSTGSRRKSQNQYVDYCDDVGSRSAGSKPAARKSNIPPGNGTPNKLMSGGSGKVGTTNNKSMTTSSSSSSALSRRQQYSVTNAASSSSSSAKSQRSRTNSSNSTRGAKMKPVLSAGSKHRQHEYDITPDDFSDEEQDIKFIDVSSDNKNKALEEISAADVLAYSQETDPQKVYDISLHGANIGKISNLGKFTRCRVLDLSSNHIQNIENLEQLRDLRELKLYDNKLKEIAQLDSLTELCNLQLQHNRIRTVGRGLSNLRKLRQLRLDNNCILSLDCKQLTACALLTYIDISNNRIDSLQALATLPCLEEIYASNNRLRNVADLTRCQKLQEVHLSHNKLSDVSGLKGLTRLTVLDVSHNQLFHLKSLGKAKSLQELYISYNKVAELSWLPAVTPVLEILNITDNSIHSLDELKHLEKLSQLVELFINGNPCCYQEGNILGDPIVGLHHDVITILPKLDILDGAHMKRPTAKGSAPLMRPMSASAAISSRQVECQIKNMQSDLFAFETDLSKKFEDLKMSFNDLPAENPNRPSSSTDRPFTGSKPSSVRSKLQQAQNFAAQNTEFDKM